MPNKSLIISSLFYNRGFEKSSFNGTVNNLIMKVVFDSYWKLICVKTQLSVTDSQKELVRIKQ